MKVRYSYLQEQFHDQAIDEIFVEIRKLIKTGEFTLGPQVKDFEGRFARLIGTRYAIGVASGTDALKLSLKAIGVGPGDEVITAANTFIATAGAIAELGARVVFVDCNENYVMDVSKVEAAITHKTKAIMPVHFTGEPVDMDRLRSITEHRGQWLVEDACQSILANYKGKNCGTMSIAAGFSLHPLKNLNVWSDGGMIVTDDQEMDQKLRLLRNHGLADRDTIECFGYNSRLDSIQAIVGNWLIGQAEEITAKRRSNAKYYDNGLADLGRHVVLPPRREEALSCFHLYMFMVPAVMRNELVHWLNQVGIEAKVHYPIPLYRQKGLKHLGYPAGTFPVADDQANRVVSLPVDQHVTREQQDYVLNSIADFFKKKGHREW